MINSRIESFQIWDDIQMPSWESFCYEFIDLVTYTNLAKRVFSEYSFSLKL